MYNSEQDLVDSFRKKSKRFLSDLTQKRSISKYFMLEEFNSNFGVADIVLGTYRPYFSKRINRKTVDENWVSALARFNIDEIIDVESFMASCFISKNTARKKLKEYSEAEFLKPIKPNKYKIIKEYETITDTVVSIEAKLKNWQRALNQANRYKKFSHYSFVMMDEKYSSPAILNLNTFKKLEIGLITMNNDNQQYKIHCIPERKKQDKSSYYLKVNEAAYSFFRHQLSAF